MDKQAILNDLRKTFGEGKTVLNAVELAQVLGTTVKAVYSLKNRDGLPVPVLTSNGRLCVSIYAVVDWLAGDITTSNPSKSNPDSPQPIPPPKRHRESMGAYLTTLRRQMDFLHELYAELERLDVIEELEVAKRQDVVKDKSAGPDQQD